MTETDTSIQIDTGNKRTPKLKTTQTFTVVRKAKCLSFHYLWTENEKISKLSKMILMTFYHTTIHLAFRRAVKLKNQNILQLEKSEHQMIPHLKKEQKTRREPCEGLK